MITKVAVGLLELFLVANTKNSVAEGFNPDIVILRPRQTAIVVTLELGTMFYKKIEKVNSCVTSIPKQHNVQKCAVVELITLRVKQTLVFHFAMTRILGFNFPLTRTFREIELQSYFYNKNVFH